MEGTDGSYIFEGVQTTKAYCDGAITLQATAFMAILAVATLF